MISFFKEKNKILNRIKRELEKRLRKSLRNEDFYVLYKDQVIPTFYVWFNPNLKNIIPKIEKEINVLKRDVYVKHGVPFQLKFQPIPSVFFEAKAFKIYETKDNDEYIKIRIKDTEFEGFIKQEIDEEKYSHIYGTWAKNKLFIIKNIVEPPFLTDFTEKKNFFIYALPEEIKFILLYSVKVFGMTVLGYKEVYNLKFSDIPRAQILTKDKVKSFSNPVGGLLGYIIAGPLGLLIGSADNITLHVPFIYLETNNKHIRFIFNVKVPRNHCNVSTFALSDLVEYRCTEVGTNLLYKHIIIHLSKIGKFSPLSNSENS